MSLFSKQIDKRIAAYQRELIETHYREVDNMYRQIRVYMDMKGTQLYISFTNFTSTKKLEKVGKLFQTTKGDGHGFGLVRIDNIIERLDGYLSRNSEDGAFTTEILIPQV